MSLATRCPACGTVFRVVRDQLKVSGGWVRCGRCSEVFNAAERLFELEAQGHAGAVVAPPPRPATARVGAALAPAIVPSSPPPEQAAPLAADRAPAIEPASTYEAPPSWYDEIDSTSGTAEAEAPTAMVASSGPEVAGEAVGAPIAADRSAEEAESYVSAVSRAAELDLRADPPTPTPGFVLRADRAERWRHPALRITLLMLSLLLLLTLAAQVALHYRDALAAQWPAARPALQGACSVLGCRVEPPRRIESLSVDSSGLVRVEGSTLYRLSLVVHNRSTTPVRMPAVDLALTDAQGRSTARRVLSAAELGQAADRLPAQGEVTLQALLELGERRVAGYTVELFYP